MGLRRRAVGLRLRFAGVVFRLERGVGKIVQADARDECGVRRSAGQATRRVRVVVAQAVDAAVDP